ncbi:uncharacterized protein LOC133196862 [Saccostrea echinata]|uniref:uncharacterized protein LOC133196862 n=1 Tax=Saccostrea echinata TaxID=191078 RepID=UPI002A814C5A|nr:uncharacterized protein LOC133196862 [Saccostrea echinata]
MDWIKYPLLAVILSIIAWVYYHQETQLKEYKLLLNTALEKTTSLDRKVKELSGTVLTSEENIATIRKKIEKTNIAMEEIKSRKTKALSSPESNITNLNREFREMEGSVASIQENMESLQEQIIDLESLVSSVDAKCELTRREVEAVIPAMTGKINLLMQKDRNLRADFNGSMLFQSLSLHRDLYISKDEKVLSNYYFPLAKSGPGIFPLIFYRGVMGNSKISLLDDVKFKFMVWFHIKKTLVDHMIIFDFSLCSKHDFDKMFYGHDCYGVHGRKYNDMIVLKFVTKSRLYETEFEHYPFSTAQAGTIYSMAFEIHINALKGIVTFSEYFSGRLIYAMDSVDFLTPLYPMFGLYNKDQVHVQLIMI